MHREPRDILRSSNLRCTRQREMVYEALALTTSHPTAEELHGMVKQHDLGLSLATIYNTLEAFVRAGLCRRIPCPTGATRYDADMTEHVHVTTADGQVVDVPPDLGQRLIVAMGDELRAELERRLGIPMDRVGLHLVVEGRGECGIGDGAGIEGAGALDDSDSG